MYETLIKMKLFDSNYRPSQDKCIEYLSKDFRFIVNQEQKTVEINYITI